MTNQIQNLPEYATEYQYIVARECDGEFWFWGAYETEKTAKKAAAEIDGIVFEN